MIGRTPTLVVLAAISLIEGLGLVGYAVYSIVEALTVGVTGPEDVSNVPAVVVLIVIQAVFGLGLLAVAWGWWRARSWARSPFVVAQLLGALLGWEIAQSDGGVERLIGIGVIVLGLAGIVLAFLPVSSRAIERQ